MKIGLIITGGRLHKWQAEALQSLGEQHQFVVYDSSPQLVPKKPLTHAGYYLLNLISVRNPLTRMVGLPSELTIVDRVAFTPDAAGIWESIPSSILQRVQDDGIEVLLKFGMGLLRVPPPEQLGVPILSYHHGDPRSYRGRPAGFYELLNGESYVGQVVQILSNQLDAGMVVAYAETRVHRHSWRKSLIDAFRISPLLLDRAIQNARDGVRVPIAPTGKNYRLPSNRTAIRFALRLLRARIKRLVYGAFFEKRWQIAEVDSNAGALPDWCSSIHTGRWHIANIPAHYRFAADPFFNPRGPGLIAEAMRLDGKGEIVSISGDNWTALPIGSGHCSYPATIEWQGRAMILPEVSDFSAPFLLEVDGDQVKEKHSLEIEGSPRLLDATMLNHEGHWYLFGNVLAEGGDVLRLWHGESPVSPFAEHRDSPIRISPAGSRMGGLPITLTGRTYRAGQDCSVAYGDGLILYEIEQLSPTNYAEREVQRLKFAEYKGPHTINRAEGRVVFDFYSDRFDLLAGFRRLGQSRAP